MAAPVNDQEFRAPFDFTGEIGKLTWDATQHRGVQPGATDAIQRSFGEHPCF